MGSITLYALDRRLVALCMSHIKRERIMIVDALQKGVHHGDSALSLVALTLENHTTTWA